MLGTALAPGLGFALVTFAFTGAANGLFCASKMTMLHAARSPSTCTAARSGCMDSLDCWGFGLAVLAGGALTTFLGARSVFAVGGVLLLVVCGLTALLLTRQPRRALVTSPAPA